MDEKDYIKTLNEMFQVESKIIDDIDCENEKIPERLEKKILKGVRKRKNRNIKIVVGTGIAVATTCLSLIIWQNNQFINKESSSSVSEIPVNEKKTKNNGNNYQGVLEDRMNAVDGPFEIIQFNRPVLLAEYIGKSESEKVPFDANNTITRYKYYYKLNSVISNKPDYEIPETFVLCVSEIYADIYPEIKEGQKVIIVVRGGKEVWDAGYSENEFIWDLLDNFYFVDENNVIKNAYSAPEYSQYNGLTVQEYVEEIELCREAIKSIQKDYPEGFGENEKELKDILKKYKERIRNSDKNR